MRGKVAELQCWVSTYGSSSLLAASAAHFLNRGSGDSRGRKGHAAGPQLPIALTESCSDATLGITAKVPDDVGEDAVLATKHVSYWAREISGDHGSQ